MTKKIYFNEAKEQIKKGVDATANAIKATLGGKGKNVIVANLNRRLQFTKDGVTVARAIDLEDELENIGAKLVKEASEKTAQEVGDGTTTSAVLVQALITEALMNTHADPILMRSGMEKGAKKVLEHLSKKKTQLKTKEQLRQVATISANDPELGEMIADIFHEIGKDGVVFIEESANLGYSKEVVKGLQVEKGFASGFFITHNEKKEAHLQDAIIIVCDYKVNSFNELAPILEKAIKAGMKQVCVIAEDYDEQVLSGLIGNKMKGVIFPLAVRAPGIGEKKRELLLDICAVTGATLITKSTGKTLEHAELSELGTAKKIVSKKDTTLFIEGGGVKQDIDNRVEQLRGEIALCDAEYEKESIRGRIARMLGGVSILKVGGSTESEINEKKDRVEDSIAATKAAMEEGILVGGGIALLNAKKHLKTLGLVGDEYKGLTILKNALEYPFFTIMRNAGKNPTDILKLLRTPKSGYNVKKEKVERDMIRAGIIDPFKVVRLCLQNAVSISGLFITTEAFIVEENPKKL